MMRVMMIFLRDKRKCKDSLKSKWVAQKKMVKMMGITRKKWYKRPRGALQVVIEGSMLEIQKCLEVDVGEDLKVCHR